MFVDYDLLFTNILCYQERISFIMILTHDEILCVPRVQWRLITVGGPLVSRSVSLLGTRVLKWNTTQMARWTTMSSSLLTGTAPSVLIDMSHDDDNVDDARKNQ